MRHVCIQNGKRAEGSLLQAFDGLDGQANMLNSQQMPDLGLEAGQGCLVDAILGDQKLVLESQRQFCQVDVAVQAEIQGLKNTRQVQEQVQVLSFTS